MSTTSGDPGNEWTQPGDPTRPVPQSPPSGYGTPSSPSYGKYGQGQAPPPAAPQPPGPPPVQPGQWPQQQWGQGQYVQRPDWQNGPGRFRPSGGLGVAVMVLSSLFTVLAWISALLAPSADRSFEDAAAAGRSTDTVYTGYDLVGLLAFPVLIGAWIVTCVWLARARENALLLSPLGQRRSTVWVWLGWLVPIVFLWFPKQILDDTIKATAPAAGERQQISTGWYWSAWITMVVLSNASVQLSFQAAPEDQVIPGLEFAIAIVMTVALVFWLLLVRRISAIQDRLAANGAAGPAGEQPPTLQG